MNSNACLGTNNMSRYINASFTQGKSVCKHSVHRISKWDFLLLRKIAVAEKIGARHQYMMLDRMGFCFLCLNENDDSNYW